MSKYLSIVPLQFPHRCKTKVAFFVPLCHLIGSSVLDFCWMCLGDWKKHGDSYYECSRYKENPKLSKESKHTKAREALKKYLFYFHRVLARLYFLVKYLLVSSVFEGTPSVQKIWGSIPEPVKSVQCRERLATAVTLLRSCVAQALN